MARAKSKKAEKSDSKSDKLHCSFSESKHRQLYKKRNYYMVDHADYLLGVFDNERRMRSGTAQTVNYALRQGKQIILIHPDTADIAYLRWITNSQKVNRQNRQNISNDKHLMI